jgi:hypothetical protein
MRRTWRRLCLKGRSSSDPSAATATATATAAAAGASASAPASHPTLDAATRENIQTIQNMGDAAFDENTAILKKMLTRGLRAFAVIAVGLVAFSVAMKRKKAQRLKEEEEAAAIRQANGEEDDDPTARYLAEMGKLGFDVEGLEEEIAERDKKLLAEAAAVGKVTAK